MSTGNSNNVSPSASPGVGSSNAPKYGTLVPNRVFVGGISPHTTEAELHQLFSSYGNVKATKIIQDRAGVSKGYGFVTFETEDEARRLQNEGDNIIFKDRKLNIAPAIKKQETGTNTPPPGRPLQPFSRMFDPSTASPTGTVLFHNGMPYTYQNGMAVFPPQEYGGYPAQPQYPVMYSQPVIMPQQNFQYQPNQPQWPQSNSHWRWTTPIGYAPQPSSGHQYVYAHSVPPSQSGGLQLITIPQQPVTGPSGGEFYVSQPPPVYHHQEAQAAATAAAAAAAAAAEHDYQQEVKDSSDGWSEHDLERLSALCLDDSAAADGRGGACSGLADKPCAADDSCSESGDDELPARRGDAAGDSAARRERSASPLPMTPPSSSVSPCADSVSSTTKSSSPQPTLGESGFASHVSSSGTEQDSCDGEPAPPAKSPCKPPKYTILAPQMSRMYMTPNAVPHYHIWTPYYTLQTSSGSAIQTAAAPPPAGPPHKGCPRHGYVAPPPPPPPVSTAGARPPCWLHSAPPPPLPVHHPSSYPCPAAPPGNEPFSPSSDQMQRARYASPCKPPLSRGTGGGYICGPRAGGVSGRCGGLKQPDLGGAGDAPPPRAEQAGGPMTPPPTPGRADQPTKVETAAARLQTMTL